MADAKRLLDLNRQARDEVAERVLQREAEDDGAGGGRGEHAVAQDQRGRHGKQQKDDRVLNDVGEAVGQPIVAPRIDDERDEEIDQAEEQQQRLKRAELRLQFSIERAVPEKDRHAGIHGEDGGRHNKLGPDVAVLRRRAPKDERRHEQGEAGEHGARW